MEMRSMSPRRREIASCAAWSLSERGADVLNGTLSRRQAHARACYRGGGSGGLGGLVASTRVIVSRDWVSTSRAAWISTRSCSTVLRAACCGI
jgi:hypothetical protein